MKTLVTSLAVVLLSCEGAAPPPRPSVSTQTQTVCGTPATQETKRVYDGLKESCASCHQAGTRAFFTSLGAFQGALVSDTRLVNPGHPDESELIKLLEGHGTGAFKQMPIAGDPYAQRVGTNGVTLSMADLRAWVTGLGTQARDNRPDPTARPITRVSALQAQRALYQQLGLDTDDFFILANEYSLPMAEPRGVAYSMQGADQFPAPRQPDSAERFLGLGGGSVVAQVRPDTSTTPTFVLTLQQVSQAWCRLALNKKGNVQLFAAGVTPSGDPVAAKATIRRWAIHFMGVTMADADVDALHAEVFAPLLAGSNATNAYVGLCSYFIRHPQWVFY